LKIFVEKLLKTQKVMPVVILPYQAFLPQKIEDLTVWRTKQEDTTISKTVLNL